MFFLWILLLHTGDWVSFTCTDQGDEEEEGEMVSESAPHVKYSPELIIIFHGIGDYKKQVMTKQVKLSYHFTSYNKSLNSKSHLITRNIRPI